MLKAYRIVEQLYVNGDLVNEYRRGIVLLEDDEVKEFAQQKFMMMKHLSKRGGKKNTAI